ncbi:MAG: response regulator [Defluviitaleaceae bacterium]|nr:response regulator [Defluviitaleaceae bacterium]
MDIKKQTIFLVDNSLESLTSGKNILSNDYNVITLNNDACVFDALEKTRPDLILLDIKMSKIGRHDVVKRLKADLETVQIPVIFLVDADDNEIEHENLFIDVIDYIPKPFSPPLLLKRIEAHLLMEAQRLDLLYISNNLEMIVEEKTKTITKLKNIFLSTMADLVEHRDHTIGGHIERTKKYLKILMDAMREYEVYQEVMAFVDEELALQSSQLHDLGKISISDSILFKPGKLTPEEFEEIKKHTTFGGKIISRIISETPDSDFLQYAKIFAETHHEKWDGSGYPKGLKGHDIPLFGRLMAIADVYDALVTDRPYKVAFPHNVAVEIIKEGSGTHFDPTLINLFMKMHTKFEVIARDVSG